MIKNRWNLDWLILISIIKKKLFCAIIRGNSFLVLFITVKDRLRQHNKTVNTRWRSLFIATEAVLRSLTLFLLHHNLRYLWSVFSMSPQRYFLPKSTILVNVGHWAPKISYCVAAQRGTHLLVIEHCINKLHLRLSCCANKRTWVPCVIGGRSK